MMNDYKKSVRAMREGRERQNPCRRKIGVSPIKYENFPSNRDDFEEASLRALSPVSP